MENSHREDLKSLRKYNKLGALSNIYPNRFRSKKSFINSWRPLKLENAEEAYFKYLAYRLRNICSYIMDTYKVNNNTCRELLSSGDSSNIIIAAHILYKETRGLQRRHGIK